MSAICKADPHPIDRFDAWVGDLIRKRELAKKHISGFGLASEKRL